MADEIYKKYLYNIISVKLDFYISSQNLKGKTETIISLYDLLIQNVDFVRHEFCDSLKVSITDKLLEFRGHGVLVEEKYDALLF